METKKRSKTILLIFFALSLAGQGCDYARMYDTEYVSTYEELPPEAPSGTVPVTGGMEWIRQAAPASLRNPLPSDAATARRGEWVYANFCIHCHGPQADGRGTVGQSFSPLPADLRSAAIRKQSDGELFAKIILGFRRHPPLAGTISPEEAWLSVIFIRSPESGRGK